MATNYPELGTVDGQKAFYPNGTVRTHPSGAVYKRIDGNWVLMKYPDGTPGPGAET